jgi:hypothetical protein
MTTLSTIEQDFSQVWAEIEANDGVLSAEAADRLDVLKLEAGTKADAYAFAIKGLEGDAEKFKALALELTAKAKTAQSRADWLKQRVKTHLEFMGATELRGEVFRFKVQKAGKAPVEVLVPVEALPREWVTITTVPNKEAIRKDLEKWGPNPPIGVSDSLARLGEPSMSFRIY